MSPNGTVTLVQSLESLRESKFIAVSKLLISSTSIALKARRGTIPSKLGSYPARSHMNQFWFSADIKTCVVCCKRSLTGNIARLPIDLTAILALVRDMLFSSLLISVNRPEILFNDHEASISLTSATSSFKSCSGVFSSHVNRS